MGSIADHLSANVESRNVADALLAFGAAGIGGGGGGGAPSGPAGGVLSGTYPNPGFAVDMATQAELNAALASVPSVTKGIVSKPGTDYVWLTDANKYVRWAGTGTMCIVPANAMTAFPIGTVIDGVGIEGAVTVVPDTGVTLNKARTLVTVGAFSGWTIIKVATDEWDVHGDFV